MTLWLSFLPDAENVVLFTPTKIRSCALPPLRFGLWIELTN